MNVEIMDLTVLSRDFPTSPPSEIRRENLLNTIDNIFDASVDAVIVEGTSGIGKTNLLAQFAKKHPNDALSVFIKPSNSIFFDPEYIKSNLCEQAHWALYKEAISEGKESSAFLRTKILNLQRQAKLSKKHFYFVIDGLHHIPPEAENIIQMVLKEILPIGMSGFRFVLSGDIETIGKYIHKSISLRSFPVTLLSLTEFKEYLSSLSLEQSELEELYKMCSFGIPSEASSVKRLLDSGVQVKNIFQAQPDDLPGFIKMEWDKYDGNDADLKKLLAFVAFSQNSCTIELLHRLTKIDKEKIKTLINNCKLLVTSSKTGQIEFISIAHRSYAQYKLKDLKTPITDLFIDDLLNKVDSDEAIDNLPAYYKQAGRSKELLNFLTPSTMSKLLDRSGSLGTVNRFANLGLETAKTLNSHDSILRFSIDKSIINQLTGADIRDSEIEAYMSLGEEEAAILLAQNANSKEERFRLLVLIAKSKILHNKQDKNIGEQIRALYNQIEIAALGEQAIDIASELIWSDPELAISMVEASIQSVKTKDNGQWSLNKISIESAGSPNGNSRLGDSTIKPESVTNPKIQIFSSKTSLYFEKMKGKDVIELVEQLDSRFGLHLLKNWTVANQQNDSAADVINYSLNLLIKDTAYSPKTGDLLDLAAPLPNVLDRNKAAGLVKRFDSLKSTTENLSTTRDYVALQLLLAETESHYDFKAASDRTIEIYYFVSNINDLSIKCNGLAQIITRVNKIDTEGKLESIEHLSEVITDELKILIDQVLRITGDHYQSARDIVLAFAHTTPEMAFDLVSKLNVESRRDRAYSDIALALIKESFTEAKCKNLIKAINHIADLDFRDAVLDLVIRRLSRKSDKITPSLLLDLMPLFKTMENIRNSYSLCKTVCFAIRLLKESQDNRFHAYIASLMQTMKNAWNSIDTAWEKLDAGFKIAAVLADKDKETSKYYLQEAEKLRNVTRLNAEEYASTYISCVELSIRVFGGLLPKHVNTEEDCKRIVELIDKIPSCGVRALLFSELAFKCFSNNDFERCKKIVSEHARPCIEQIKETNLEYKYRVTVGCSPALYKANKSLTLEAIYSLPKNKKDEALNLIFDSILTKKFSTEPCDTNPETIYTISYDDAYDLCEILEKVDSDYIVYGLIETLVNNLLARQNRTNCSPQQKVDIVEKLRKIISQKLPDQRNITHLGYKIIAEAQVSRLCGEKQQHWNQLALDARNIPNVADKAFVLSTLAEFAPTTLSKENLITEALGIIENIPVSIEKIDQYRSIASRINAFDDVGARKALSSAMTLSFSSGQEDEVMYPKRRAILDIAYTIDPEFADQLVAAADHDPARLRANIELKQHLKTLSLQREMVSANRYAESQSKAPAESYSKAAWMSLSYLNSGKVHPVHFDNLFTYLEAAASLKISESYPLLAWMLENIIQRCSKTDQARSVIIPLFQTTLLSAEVALRLSNKFSNETNTLRENSKDVNRYIIGEKEREAALSVISDWFKDHVKDYLKICDPYFCVDDLELVRLLYSIQPACRVIILTSAKAQDKNVKNQEDAYRGFWRSKYVDVNKPNIKIIIAGTELSGDMPLHDRWLITKLSGLRLGTSFNSIGNNKLSDISFLSDIDSLEHEAKIDEMVNFDVQEFAGQKIKYTLFNI